MRLVFLGSGEIATPTLAALLRSEHRIACVVTQPDRPAGRGRRLTPTPVHAAARTAGLDVIATANVNSPELVERIRALDAAVGVVVAFGQKLGPDLLSSFSAGCINLHPSILPRHRGAAPIQWALIVGDAETGVTVFRLVDRMDAGPILVAKPTSIQPAETAAELHDRLAVLGADAVCDALAMFENGRLPDGVPQDDGQVTFAPKLKKEDGWIDFAVPAHILANRINGMWSWPGASCRFHSAARGAEETVTLARAQLTAAVESKEPPGSIDGRLTIATARGRLEVLEIKPQGGRLMTWAEFVNGRHVRAGDRLIPLGES